MILLLRGVSLELQDRLTATMSSISIDNDQGIFGLGQYQSLSNLMGNGMAPHTMRELSTELLHDDKQL